MLVVTVINDLLIKASGLEQNSPPKSPSACLSFREDSYLQVKCILLSILSYAISFNPLSEMTTQKFKKVKEITQGYTVSQYKAELASNLGCFCLLF